MLLLLLMERVHLLCLTLTFLRFGVMAGSLATIVRLSVVNLVVLLSTFVAIHTALRERDRIEFFLVFVLIFGEACLLQKGWN